MDYRIPSRPKVSPACVHLISKLLVADPNGRLTPEGIMKHPWFRQNLPPGVENLNEKCLRMKVGLSWSCVEPATSRWLTLSAEQCWLTWLALPVLHVCGRIGLYCLHLKS